MNEIEMLKMCHQQNIIHLNDVFETLEYYCIVTDFCEYGDLMTYVRKRRRISEDLARDIMIKMLDGLGYLHSKGILH